MNYIKKRKLAHHILKTLYRYALITNESIVNGNVRTYVGIQMYDHAFLEFNVICAILNNEQAFKNLSIEDFLNKFKNIIPTIQNEALKVKIANITEAIELLSFNKDVECVIDSDNHIIKLVQKGTISLSDRYYLRDADKYWKDSIYDFTKWLAPILAFALSVFTLIRQVNNTRAVGIIQNEITKMKSNLSTKKQ